MRHSDIKIRVFVICRLKLEYIPLMYKYQLIKQFKKLKNWFIKETNSRAAYYRVFA